MSGNVANPTNDNTNRQYHRKRREIIEGNLKTTGTTSLLIVVFTDAKIKEQDEKQKEKNLDDFENGNSNFRVFTREIANLRWQDSLYLIECLWWRPDSKCYDWRFQGIKRRCRRPKQIGKRTVLKASRKHAKEHYGQKQMLENCELYMYASHWCQRLFYFNICTEVSLLVNVLHTPSAPTKKHI